MSDQNPEFTPDMSDEEEMRTGAMAYAVTMAAQMNTAGLFYGKWTPSVIKTDAGIHSIIGMHTAHGTIEVSLHPVLQVYIAVINAGKVQHKAIDDNMEQALHAVLNSQTVNYADVS